MSTKQDTSEITLTDGSSLSVTVVKFEPVTAYRLLAKIGRVLIPTVFAARHVTGKSDTTDLMPAIKTLFEQLTPELAETVMLEALSGTSVTRADDNGHVQNIDLVHGTKAINRAFRGNLKAMLLAIKFSLEVNYGDFFVGSDSVAETETPTPSL